MTQIPFHRLGRGADHRWWRPLLGGFLLGALIVGAMLVMIVAALVAGAVLDLHYPESDLGLPPLPEVLVGLAVIAVILPAVFITVRLVGNRPAGTVSSVAGRIRWRWLGLCCLIAAPMVLAMFGVMMAVPGVPGEELDESWNFPGWPMFAVSVLLLALLVPLQAAAEEYLCRGWLLQAVGAWVRRPWAPIGVQAVVFAALHGWGTGWGFGGLVIAGAVAGLLAVRTGGIEAYIALHVMNNLFAFWLAAAAGALADDGSAADLPWQLVLIAVVTDLAFAAIVLWLAKRRGLVTTASPAPVEAGPAVRAYETVAVPVATTTETSPGSPTVTVTR